MAGNSKGSTDLGRIRKRWLNIPQNLAAGRPPVVRHKLGRLGPSKQRKRIGKMSTFFKICEQAVSPDDTVFSTLL